MPSKASSRHHTRPTQRWSETCLHEAQAGFRQGRSVDDPLQVSRRIVEEATFAQVSNEVILIRLFDTEKAYPWCFALGVVLERHTD